MASPLDTYTWEAQAPGSGLILSSAVGSPNTKELFEHSSQFLVTFIPELITDDLSPLVITVETPLPDGLTFTQDTPEGLCTLSGVLGEMDNFVPEFMIPDGSMDTADTINGNYATTKSAGARTKDFTFDVKAVAPNGYEETATFTVTLVNNFNSDRDNLIRNMPPPLMLDGVSVSPEDYLVGMKAKGHFPD